MHPVTTTVLFEPADESLRYLPEGLYRCPDGRLSWVAIQHGPEQQRGSLNLLDLQTGVNQAHVLPGRPGFAFPTERSDEFVVGMERAICRVNVRTNACDELVAGIDADVTETIINDGVVCDDHIIFGCKDLKFADTKGRTLRL